MAILYKLRQDNRRTSRHKGCWFAHAVNSGTVDTDMLARIIERNCSLKRSDVLAVLAELSDAMRDLLADLDEAGYEVKVTPSGSYRRSIGMEITPENMVNNRTTISW